MDGLPKPLCAGNHSEATTETEVSVSLRSSRALSGGACSSRSAGRLALVCAMAQEKLVINRRWVARFRVTPLSAIPTSCTIPFRTLSTAVHDP